MAPADGTSSRAPSFGPVERRSASVVRVVTDQLSSHIPQGVCREVRSHVRHSSRGSSLVGRLWRNRSTRGGHGDHDPGREHQRRIDCADDERPPAADGIDGTGIAAKMVMALVKAGSGRYDMVSSGAAGGQQVTMTAKSEFVVVNGAMDSKATMSVAGGSMEVVSVGGVMYMKGLIKSKDGKPWVKIDPNGTDEFSKRMAPQLKSAADLRSQVEVYEGSKATLIGTDAGVRHYRLTGVSSAPAQPFDIYLDASDLPVKVTTKSDSMEMTITYSGFGDAVTVTAPPAAQVGPPPAM